MNHKIQIFDSTLRDGAQGEGIQFSLADKLAIVRALDGIGIDYIEAGGTTSKDLEFFAQAQNLPLKNSKLAAFGATRRAGISVADDASCAALLKAETPAVVIFGKSWDLHVEKIIQTTLTENLSMIFDTVEFFAKHGKEVIYDAEHFFDGCKANRDYALETLKAAIAAGTSRIVLCDTNGGCLPDEVAKIAAEVAAVIDTPLGIHCHNDTGCAVANSIMAVLSGCTQVQGTFLGFGERCGNANLSAVIANLQLKRGYLCIPPEQMKNLTSTARFIADVSNVSLTNDMPYAGKSAFAHKAGMHADGVSKIPESFEHIAPDKVGNARRFLMSEVAGRSAILEKISKIDGSLTKESAETQKIAERLKELEQEGYQFEAADASFELMVLKELGRYEKFFDLDYFTTIVEEPSGITEYSSSAVIKITVDGRAEITAAEGDGPVHALDKALRKALEVFYPSLKNIHLCDYKVRVLDPQNATSAKVRVLIETTDGKDTWSTVGVSKDVIDASWKALVDAIEYKLIKDI